MGRKHEEALGDGVAALVSAIQAGRGGRILLLLLDYDGTLVDIAPLPQLARPEAKLLRVLGRLASRPDLQAVVVSGRPLHDLQRLLPVPGLGFLGSHGGEVFLEGRHSSLPVAEADKRELSRWRERLGARLQSVPGWWLEDKPQGFGLHYRQVPAAYSQEFITRLEKWQEEVQRQNRFQVLAGRKVLEIMPLGVSKGQAVEAVLRRPAFLESFPVYVGDDLTDESAFRVLQGRGLTIKVGRPGIETAASHFLPDPRSVRRLLAMLACTSEDRT